ncbi:hypothetical protein R1sor_008627 [Riccia sorocarpa]|uniref:Gag protein n=1 Tax=Riccia sorocarpa TaxID=122646 RepID=A0ABD3HY36_9MARC
MNPTRRLRSGREYHTLTTSPADRGSEPGTSIRETGETSSTPDTQENVLHGLAALFQPPILPAPVPIIMANTSIIPPGTVAYHGVEDFNAFIDKFDNICIARNIENDADKARQLGQLFVGSAASWYSRLDPAVKDSYAQVLAAGRTEYVPTTLQEQFRDKLDQVQTLATALTEARTYAQCEERGSPYLDPTYYIPGLKGQVMVNPYSVSGPYIPQGASSLAPTGSVIPVMPAAAHIPTPPQPPTSWFPPHHGVDTIPQPTAQFLPTIVAFPTVITVIPNITTTRPPANMDPTVTTTANVAPTAPANTEASSSNAATRSPLATAEQVTQMMVKLEQIHLNQKEPNRHPVNTAARGQISCTRCHGIGHTNDQCVNPQIHAPVLCTYCVKRGHTEETCHTKTRALQIQQAAPVLAIGNAGQPNPNPPQYNVQLQNPAPRQNQAQGRGRGRPVFRALLQEVRAPAPPARPPTPPARPPAPANANINYIAVVEDAPSQEVNHISQTDFVMVTTRSPNYRLHTVQEDLTTSSSSDEEDPTVIMPRRPAPSHGSPHGTTQSGEDPALQMYRLSVPIFNTLSRQPVNNSIFYYDLVTDLANIKANITIKQLLDMSPSCRKSLSALVTVNNTAARTTVPTPVTASTTVPTAIPRQPARQPPPATYSQLQRQFQVTANQPPHGSLFPRTPTSFQYT